ncbi:hypothetical protein HY933_03410 [Candidatus Falkowbacteria bacterium]|nr:hypothetical protein [Candidatus Falkowbacteria bacterium]
MPRRKSVQPKNPKKPDRAVPTIALYRKVVISFVILTTILIVLVLYFSFVSADITVIPQPETLTADFSLKVVEAEDGLVPDQVNGIFFDQTAESKKDFTATGSQTVSSDVVGRVTIVNTYRRPQPLVATTRLLSADNVLLHITDRVDVPVGGTVDVDVYADDPNQLKDRTIPVGTRFTIPGLWPQLQDKIYAESATPLQLGDRTVTVLTPEDIDRATQAVIDQLELQTFVSLGLDGNVAKAVTVVDPQITVSAGRGDAVSAFTVSVKATVRGVLFDKDKLLRLAEDRMRSSLPADKQLLSTDPASLQYDIQDVNVKAKTAVIRVQLTGASIIKLNSDIFDKDRLKGLSRQQVESYFASQPSVGSVIIKFFPFWIKTVPQLPDHINVTLE